MGIVEYWNNGILGSFRTLKVSLNHGIDSSMDRINIKRGFRKPRVWQDAVSLYVAACTVFANFPFELKKVTANSIDAAHSIAPAINYTTAVIPAKAGHVVKLLRYPERHWIPDQARHDRAGYLVARLIYRAISQKAIAGAV